MNYFILFVCTLCCVSHLVASEAIACGQSNSQLNNERLIGGQPTLPNEFPWQVFIDARFMQYINEEPSCLDVYGVFWETSGVLLSDLWILTSARGMQWGDVVNPAVCDNVTYGEPVAYPPANEITLIFGAHNVSKGQNSETEPQRKVVSKGQLFLHPKWDVNKTNEMIPYDLALIRLPEPITFNDYIRPICLPDALDSDDHIGDNVKLTGWGKKSTVSISHQYDLNGVLHQSDNTVLSNDQCKPNFPGFNLDDQMIACVGGPSYAYYGDEGGPMAHSQDGVNGWTLFGILSDANGVNPIPPNNRKSSIGIRVQPHLEWIYSLMNDENPTTPRPTPMPSTSAPDNGTVPGRSPKENLLWRAITAFCVISAHLIAIKY